MFTRKMNKSKGLLGLWEHLTEADSNTLSVVPIGRGHAGKTNLINSIPRVLDTLPSGIRIGYNDLKHLNEALIQVRRTEQDLSRGGLPPTLERSYRTLGLFSDEVEELRLRISDEIGQPITNTTPDSPAEQLQRFEDYAKAGAQADVLWVTTSLPANNSSQSIGLFRDDLARYQCWLSESIRRRVSKKPVSIAIVVTKFDAIFPTSEQASSQATREWLVDQLLKPLVGVVQKGISNGRVKQGAVIPVSAFGFGNAKLVAKDSVKGIAYEDHEEEYILKAEASLEPFNILTLMVWSFFAAVSATGDQKFRQIETELCKDLAVMSKWLMPIR